MAKYRVLKNSLLGGQISRNAAGRTDLPQYLHSCELLQNMIPLLSGGAYRRPGTVFQDFVPADWRQGASPVTGSRTAMSSPPRLFDFIVSNKTAYAVLIGTNRWATAQGGPINPSNYSGGSYMRYFRATGNTDSGVLVHADAAKQGVLPYRCKSANVAASGTDQCYYTRQGGPGAVANSGTNGSAAAVFDVADSLQSYDDDVWAVQYCQANDVMFLTHPDYPPQTIWLNAADDLRAQQYDYSLTGLAYAQSRPYLNQNSTAVTMSLALVGPNLVLTSSAPFFNALHGPRKGCLPQDAPVANDGAIFAIGVGTGSTMTGNNADNGILYMLVTSVTSSTTAIVTGINTLPSNYALGTATTVWWESAWSNYRGWPRACGIYQQRLAFAATTHQPNAIWFTATGAYGAPVSGIADAVSCKFTALGDGPNQGYKSGTTGVLANGKNFTTAANWVYYPTDDSQGDGQATGPIGSQPFRVSLATTSLDGIQYLSPDQQLFIGTATQEWLGAPENGSFDVANSTFTTQSHYGSDAIQAIRIGYEMMFVLQKQDEIRAYQYNYFDQSFFGEPVQLFFDEYPLEQENTAAIQAGRRKYRQMNWDTSRSTLWCTDTAGNLFGLTRDRKLAVTTWHTHQLGGFNAAHGSGQNNADNLTAGNTYVDPANALCDGSVVSVCSTPNPFSGIRDLWMVVKRSMGTNSTIYSVERMIGGNTVRQSAYSVVAPGNAQEPCYVDSAYFITDSGNPANFDYSVGAQMQGATLLGAYYSQLWGLFAIGLQGAVGAAGAISLQTNLPADYGDLTKNHTIVVGYGYNSVVKPVRVDPPSAIGTSMGAIKRNSKAYLRLFKTLMLKMGAPPELGFPLEQVQWAPAAQMGMSPEIFTGDKEVFLPTTFDRDGYVYILQDQPLPFTLVSLSLEGMAYEQ